jgi:hypothetical protein
MQIHSEPAMTEEEVTDLDVAFLGGQSSSITLRVADKLQIRSTDILVFKSGENIVINMANVLFYSTRRRIIRTPKPGPPKAPEPSPVDTMDV